MAGPGFSSLVDALARQQASALGIPAALLVAQIARESQGNPAAVGDQGRALGLLQVHPAAAQEAGFQHHDMLDPMKNLQAGSQYLVKQLLRFSRPELALSAYNAGPAKTAAVGTVAPSARGYVSDIASKVRALTDPGAPYAEEAVPLPDEQAAQLPLNTVMDRDRAVRILKQLRGIGAVE